MSELVNATVLVASSGVKALSLAEVREASFEEKKERGLSYHTEISLPEVLSSPLLLRESAPRDCAELTLSFCRPRTSRAPLLSAVQRTPPKPSSPTPLPP